MALQVEQVALELVAALRPLMPRIRRHSRSLCDQLQRAADSIVLNLCEAAYSDPGNRRARFHTAAGSANETGGVAALPIWISFMQRALKGVPEKPITPPEGVIQVRINPDTGLRDDSSNLTEYFLAELPPAGRSESFGPSPASAPGKAAPDVREQLF